MNLFKYSLLLSILTFSQYSTAWENPCEKLFRRVLINVQNSESPFAVAPVRKLGIFKVKNSLLPWIEANQLSADLNSSLEFGLISKDQSFEVDIQQPLLDQLQIRIGNRTFSEKFGDQITITKEKTDAGIKMTTGIKYSIVRGSAFPELGEKFDINIQIFEGAGQNTTSIFYQPIGSKVSYQIASGVNSNR